jgi:hypothetical protein
MAPGSYPAASALAPKVEALFARDMQLARSHGLESGGFPPGTRAIEAIIDAAFWASLRREETYSPKISLALLPPEHSPHPLRFERPLALTAGALARLAPAVERPGIHLGVWEVDGALAVWGTARDIPAHCFVLEVSAPGLLVIKHRHAEDTGKFVNLAVLEGDEVKMVDPAASRLPDCPALLAALTDFRSPASWVDPVNVLVQLSVSMRAHGRGGLLLVVPPASDAWHASIAGLISYAMAPPYRELSDLLAEPADERQTRRWRDGFERAVSAVAGLTAVDGATVVTSRYELLAFGAKLTRRRGQQPVSLVAVTEPLEGSAPTVVEPSQLGGTRHFYAAQFVQDQQDALALVASQDGRFTVFAWSPCETRVHAHRVETLLL